MPANTMTALADELRRLEVAALQRPSLQADLQVERARVRYLRALLTQAEADRFVARSPMARKMMEGAR